MRTEKSLCVMPFPKAGDFPADPQIEQEFKPILSAITSLRAFRGESGIPFGTRFTAYAIAGDEAARTSLGKYRVLVEKLTNSDVAFGWDQAVAHAVLPNVGFELRVPLAGLVDLAEEKVRATRELEKLEKELAGIAGRLGNESFRARAPKEVVDKDEARAAELRARQEKLAAHLATLG